MCACYCIYKNVFAFNTECWILLNMFCFLMYVSSENTCQTEHKFSVFEKAKNFVFGFIEQNFISQYLSLFTISINISNVLLDMWTYLFHTLKLTFIFFSQRQAKSNCLIFLQWGKQILKPSKYVESCKNNTKKIYMWQLWVLKWCLRCSETLNNQ